MALKALFHGLARVAGSWASSDGGETAARMLRDGSLSVADLLAVLAMEGRLFTASVGTASTPATFKTGYTAAQPELAIDVPVGTLLLPIDLEVYLEDSAGTDNEVVVLTSSTAVGAGTSTELSAATIGNHRTDIPRRTAARVYTLHSANGTAPTIVSEIFRGGYPFADATGAPEKRWSWSIFRNSPHVVVGPGSLVVYVGGTVTAPAGFIKASWAELPTTVVT